MGIVTAIIIMVISFILYILLRSANQIFASFYLFLIFILAYILTDKQFSVFYILLFLVAVVIDLAIKEFDITPTDNVSLAGISFKGFSLISISLIFGVVVYIIISLISTKVGGNIVGAPKLQVTTSQIAQNLRPTFVSHLGIIENYFVFVMYEILSLFGVIIPLIGIAFNFIPYVMPILIVSITMGILHVVAYSVAISLIIWAVFAFSMFIISYLIMGNDSLPADTAHVLNNGIIDLNRPLALVI